MDADSSDVTRGSLADFAQLPLELQNIFTQMQ